ncbi:flagellar basal body rod protein FlgB [Marinobacter sp.]|jgi:flagellar basal-body rod protein FlgB|uniref:flagellar basal body rod protein FlgB n=1 Tax=Marinobacter sp. TaxID=50741 RepID=UPI000C678CA1|nr:flagellar basal body rod protein FlgB [Marinobacter sp.]MBE96880.1 flagellar basal body rod protein FlgB [Marinobacter sp.]|tara:strand:- start:1860 stop:2258 length:399 start_codon:yes stop_codon:yes gene_type:complete
MAISLDKALGIHQHALEGRVRRAEVLANNLANADTPGYKARDVDFQAMMQKAQDSMSGFGMTRTHESHMDTSSMGADSELLYRVPHQPSVDGNTVDAQQEQTRFMRNAMDYQASFQFLDGKVSGIKKALSGQ